MDNFFARQAVTFNNDSKRCTGALLGIVQGLLADQALNDAEIGFLRSWLESNQTAIAGWPGNAIAAQIDAALADGVVTDEERAHLVDTLQRLIGGTFQELAESTHVTSLALDPVDVVEIEGRTFCLTGNFLLGTRPSCEELIARRGGVAVKAVSKKVDYLVLGSLGSEEWKHGSFGTKLERAMELRASGGRPLIVHEDPFAAAIMGLGA